MTGDGCTTTPTEPPTGDLPAGWFRELKVGHDPRDPAEATLVLAAAAAANGLRCDGQPMPGAEFSTAPSLNAIARQLCLHIDTVRRGVAHLVKIDAVHFDNGVHADPSALTSRWANHRQRIRITGEARLLRMRAKPLLLTALVAGQVDERGQLRLGIGFLMERTGFSRRAVDRALRTARNAKAIHTWNTPPHWQLFLALGQSRSGARSGSQGGARRRDAGGPDATGSASEPLAGREAAQPPIAKRRDPPRETASTGSQSGVRPPDSPGLPPDSPTEVTPASPAGETRAAPAAESPASDLQPKPAEVRAAIDAWVKRYADNVSFDTGSTMEVVAVATLIDSISPRPAGVHDPRAFARERLALARKVIGWCPWPDRLGRWLVRAHRWFRVQDLGAYLRRASEKGNPDTLLHSHSKNILGRAAETWQDFSPQTERALRGPCADAIEQLVAGISGVLEVPDEDQRVQLREELARYWKQQRRVAARITLQRLVGNDRSDVAIARAADGILTHRQAKWLLGVA